MQPVAMKVGELARRTGVTVRTLHYYDELGLLSPSRRSEAGYRLYGADDIARLQQIASLRQLGFSLDEIRACLSQPDFSPERVVELHLARLREQMALQQHLCNRLETLAAHLRAAEDVSVAAFLQTIEAITMFEKYYTPEQLEALAARRAIVGEERIRQVEAEWPTLMAEVRAEMDKGTDPASERVQELARRWMGLVNEFTGGDAGIAQSLGTMYEHEQENMQQFGSVPNQEMFAYINKAMAAGK